jgi:hypothetical protein
MIQTATVSQPPVLAVAICNVPFDVSNTDAGIIWRGVVGCARVGSDTSLLFPLPVFPASCFFYVAKAKRISTKIEIEIQKESS